MSSAVVTALLLTVTLLIIGSFIFSAWLVRHRHLRALKNQAEDQAAVGDRIMLVVQMGNGSVVGVDNPLPVAITNKLPTVVSSAYLSHRWYNKQRTVVSLGLLLMLLLGLLVETGVAGDALQTITHTLGFSSQSSGFGLQAAFQPIPDTASALITRVDSTSRNQYYSDYQYQVWSFSSCSGISLEEIMNAYGRHYIAADVLQVELNMGIWSIANGLLGGEPSMAKVATYYGFQTSSTPPRTLNDLITTANKGTPVIVGSTNHIMVVKGGDANYVYVVDSSTLNRQTMTHEQFMAFWDGFTVLITPAKS